MSSGLDVYLEKGGDYYKQLKWIEDNTQISVSHNKPFPVNVNNVKHFYVRVNHKGISWGHQRQIDDNVVITYDLNTNSIVRIEQL